MKRIIAVFLAALLGLISLSAAAQPATADHLSAHGADLCVYVGEENRLYAAEEPEPLIEDRVSAILYASDTLVVFTAPEETNEDFDREGTLVALDLAVEPSEQSDIASNVTAALWSENDGVLYFVTHDAPTALMTYDPMRAITEQACDAGEEILRLRLSADGLLVNTASGEKLYVPVMRSMIEPQHPAQNSTIAVGDRYEAILDADGVLSLRAFGSADVAKLDQGVFCAIIEDNIIYYLVEGGPNAPCLKAYTIETGTTAGMHVFGEAMRPALTLDAGYIFAMGESGVLYRYMLQSGECVPISVIDLTDVYVPAMSAFDGLLLVYDLSREAGETFVATIETGTRALEPEEVVPVPAPEEIEPEDDMPEEDEEDEAAPTPTRKPSPTATPAPEFTTLSNGSRGEAVVRLQKKLKELGYLDGSADGVYGKATQVAVTYLQGDMGYTETGSAGPKFQHAVFYGHPPTYERYKPLSKGDEGIRVQEMQARLRTLNYMAVNAGGHYQDNTVAAVKRFQKQMGYKQTNHITAKQLKALFSKSCPECTEYFTLKKGDSAPAVKKLNKRLIHLGYLSGKAGSSYDKHTVQAIELFQMSNGLLATGKCTANLQYMIYDKNAKPYQPEPRPDPTPKPTPKPSPSEQVITDKQVKVIRNFLNKHFGTNWNNKKAVSKLQSRLVDLDYMNSGEESGIYDSRTKKAVMNYQTVEMGLLGAGGIADKAVLKHLFP